MQIGVVWCRLVQFCAGWCSLVQVVAVWCLVQFDAYGGWFELV